MPWSMTDHDEKLLVVSESVSAEPLQRFELAPERFRKNGRCRWRPSPNLAGIGAGTTVIATDAVSQDIARPAAVAIAASGVMRDGFSLSNGHGMS